jgi:hypothetical protein
MAYRVLAIRLPEDNECINPTSNGYCNCTVRTGGDKLEGEIGIFAPFGEKLTVEVRFEG